MKYTIYRHETGVVMYKTSDWSERMYTPIIRTDSERFALAALRDLQQREPKKEEEHYAKYMY